MRMLTAAIVASGCLVTAGCGSQAGPATAPTAAPSSSSESASADPARGVTTIQGFVAGVRGACPNVSIAAGGVAITTSARTSFEGTSCERLKTRDQIEVTGARTASGALAATRVKKL